MVRVPPRAARFKEKTVAAFVPFASEIPGHHRDFEQIGSGVLVGASAGLSCGLDAVYQCLFGGCDRRI